MRRRSDKDISEIDNPALAAPTEVARHAIRAEIRPTGATMPRQFDKVTQLVPAVIRKRLESRSSGKPGQAEAV